MIERKPVIRWVKDRRRRISLAMVALGAALAAAAAISVASTPQERSGTAGVDLEFVSIPPGEFMRGRENGDGREEPVHQVRITRAFELGRHEVTQAQWEAIMGTNPSFFEGADRPVDNVTWNEVQQFLRQLNERQDGYHYRLPTEAEWEYACRAGTTGDYAGDLDAMAWYHNNSGGETHPVGRKEPNAWGLYDMHGNLWEWVQDWYGDYSDGSFDDPGGPPSGREKVRRGGSFGHDAMRGRCSRRYRNAADYRREDIGFRIARTPVD